jgi:hypothetical protein
MGRKPGIYLVMVPFPERIGDPADKPDRSDGGKGPSQRVGAADSCGDAYQGCDPHRSRMKKRSCSRLRSR